MYVRLIDLDKETAIIIAHNITIPPFHTYYLSNVEFLSVPTLVESQTAQLKTRP
jgi:hypothetical protein